MSNIKTIEDLDRYLDQLAAEDEFSGVVLMAKGENILFQKACGMAEKNFSIPNQLHTKFNLGSMNKMFTGVAIAQQAQEGKLDFSAPLATYLPEYSREKAERITLHHLLTHTSGLGSYWNEAFEAKRMTLRSVNDFLPLFMNDPLLFSPGHQWHYSNAGFIVLGAVIEQVTGQDYFTYVREHIYYPASMYNTDAYELDHIVPNLAVGYTTRGVTPFSDTKQNRQSKKRKNNLLLHVVKGGPAGGGYSTVQDLLQFSQALRSHILLSPIFTKIVLDGKVDMTDISGRRYAYGFAEGTINGQPVFGHNGGFPGINASFEFTYDTGDTVVVLSNYDPPIASQVAKTMWEVFGQL